jgi:hypothetical protein
MQRRTSGLIATLVLAGAAVTAPGVSAAEMTEMAPHPAHIHVGSCPAPGEVVGPLANVSGQFLMDETATATEPMGQTTAIPVEASVTSAVPLAYADLFASPHAIVVHHSEADMATYILCGDIGGPEMGATDIAVGLGALNDSGYAGIATIHDNGDSTLKVSLYILSVGGGMAEPMESMAPMESEAPA